MLDDMKRILRQTFLYILFYEAQSLYTDVTYKRNNNFKNQQSLMICSLYLLIVFLLLQIYSYRKHVVSTMTDIEDKEA